MTHLEPERSPLAALLERAAAVDPARPRAAFLERWEHERERRTLPAARWLAACIAVALAFGLAFTMLRSDGTPRYVVRGAVDESGYVRVPMDHAANIVFSDETRITAEAGARLRIDDAARSDGARISLERGNLHAQVTHTGHGNWRFVAGPFQVRVTGTRFTLGWDAEKERLEVVLEQGSVDVSGYAGSGSVSVRAGQRFLGDAREKTMLVANAEGPAKPALSFATPSATVAAVAGEESPLPSAPATPVTSSAPASASASTSGSTKVAWAKLVAKGQFQRVVEEAAARGTDDCIATCSAADLTALADAARYVGQSGLAERSLRELRRRFPGEAAGRAAFLLGRLDEGRGEAAAARNWYETALREASGGSFASEALAGKMRTVKALEGAEAARRVALDYLKRYPNGVDARTARQLAEAP